MQVGRLAALKAQRTYNPEGASSWRTWAVRYIRRDMIRFLKAEHLRYIDIDELVDRDDVEELTDYNAGMSLEYTAEVERMLDILEPIERDVVVEHLYNDKSFAEIAQEKGVTRQAVSKHWRDAVAWLRQYCIN